MWGRREFLDPRLPEHLLNWRRLHWLGDVRRAFPSWDEGLEMLYETLYLL